MPTICIDGEETFEVDSDGQRVNEVVLSLAEYRNLQNSAYKRQAGVLRIADDLHRAWLKRDLAEIDWPQWPGYETCDGWSRDLLVQRFTELRLAYEVLEEQADADIIPRFPQPETTYFQITALKQPSAAASGISITTNSWWTCPDCGGLAVANRIGWRCTRWRCGAHGEWGSETCPGDYCEDGCDQCVGTP